MHACLAAQLLVLPIGHDGSVLASHDLLYFVPDASGPQLTLPVIEGSQSFGLDDW